MKTTSYIKIDKKGNAAIIGKHSGHIPIILLNILNLRLVPSNWVIFGFVFYCTKLANIFRKMQMCSHGPEFFPCTYFTDIFLFIQQKNTSTSRHRYNNTQHIFSCKSTKSNLSLKRQESTILLTDYASNGN